MCPNMHWTIVERIWRSESDSTSAPMACLLWVPRLPRPVRLSLQRSRLRPSTSPATATTQCLLQRTTTMCQPKKTCNCKRFSRQKRSKMASSSIRHHVSSIVSFPTSSPVLSLVVDSLQKLRQLHTSGETVGLAGLICYNFTQLAAFPVSFLSLPKWQQNHSQQEPQDAGD